MSQQLELFPDHVYLCRIDPAENTNRYYGMHLERNLFVEWCLVREWGRSALRDTHVEIRIQVLPRRLMHCSV
ncbi:MAG: WGR domain-containing protein [Rhodobacteraceae bacterium]|nr:WGR domain-containing protein [Paracoccaceae bacterium]